ncbi:hypothetical protein FB45DRAFT_34607 [Roridomyces roridus]|uniref:Uncharacterized protein n=1 Tax=Roridomyces roridus TaxID=1738132 RepID=A0AAD7G3C7_9AGAR|nr:hypothetical protein FB45DRAFT_34607 [Roridomyces roridus]
MAAVERAILVWAIESWLSPSQERAEFIQAAGDPFDVLNSNAGWEKAISLSLWDALPEYAEVCLPLEAGFKGRTYTLIFWNRNSTDKKVFSRKEGHKPIASFIPRPSCPECKTPRSTEFPPHAFSKGNREFYGLWIQARRHPADGLCKLPRLVRRHALGPEHPLREGQVAQAGEAVYPRSERSRGGFGADKVPDQAAVLHEYVGDAV